jgi:uncharacterized Zn-finger protein
MRRKREQELETATGTLMTQITCPHCSTVFDLEGDREGEKVKCPDCGEHSRVRRI